MNAVARGRGLNVTVNLTPRQAMLVRKLATAILPADHDKALDAALRKLVWAIDVEVQRQ